MFEDKGDRFAQILEALVSGVSLAIGSRYLCAVGDVPGAGPLHNRGELIALRLSLPRRSGAHYPNPRSSAWIRGQFLPAVPRLTATVPEIASSPGSSRIPRR